MFVFERVFYRVFTGSPSSVPTGALSVWTSHKNVRFFRFPDYARPEASRSTASTVRTTTAGWSIIT